MAPKKRRDLGENDEAVAAGSMDPSAVAQGHVQPLGSDDHTPEPTPTPEPEDQLERDAPHKSDQYLHGTARPNDGDSEVSVHTVRPSNHFEDISIEELESELQLAMIQNALIKKRRHEKVQASHIPVSVPKNSVPQTSARHVSILKESAIPDSDSILRESQNERLRRAGLLPPRASEVRHFPAATPTITARQPSVPPTLLLSGIDKKISEIMNSTNSSATSVTGERPEISRAGIKISGPEKWKGERSLQAFTDWIRSVAHYFKVHSPLSDQLKITLIGGYLVGDPLDWYWRHVAPHSSQWTSTNVMVALRRQFLVDELSRQAADDFDSVEQGSRDVHAFQAHLLKLADQMSEFPSSIALNRRLLNGMKVTISSAIIGNRGIDAELSQWEDIVQTAMDQERAQRYASAPKSASESNDSPHEALHSIPQDDVQKETVTPARASLEVEIQGLNNPRFRPFSSMRNPTSAPVKSVGPKSTDRCRSCGVLGHWANECPQRLRTNHIDFYDANDNFDHYAEPNSATVEAFGA